LVPGGDSSLSGSIGDPDATIHVGRPPKRDIQRVPLEMHTEQARWKLEQCSKITQGVEMVPGGDSSLSGSIGDTDATMHVGRPPNQDIEHVPLEMQSTQARWRLAQCSISSQGVWIGPWW
jgi:hypothetical protein